MEPDNGQAASASRKWLYLSLVILLLGLIIAGAFLMGTRRPEVLSNTAATPTPSPEISPTPTPEVTPILTPKITAKPTSTLKPAPTVTPTPTTAPVSQTTIINSIVSLDGFRANNNGGNNSIEIRAGNGSMVGAPAYELVIRGFTGFDIPTAVLSGKTIESAVLRLYQYKVTGTPYSGGNKIIVDHLDYGDSLEGADYSATAISSGIATLTANAVIEWKDAEVTSALKADLSAGHSRSQYRLRLSTETDGSGTEDVAYFHSSNTGYTGYSAAFRPQLVIKYH
ncbi:MAG: hypothetical protein UX87_C0026G0005 [Candidatus Amesbacteria bacterium GW2011_GWA1_47_16]|uniref:Uncharacterized protein n=4 Tax=Candidatus Amesiibacteriota TaxID=1752730 RepID=A0A0G1S2Q8_9BACT|nr:MAG: hypothetical protein UX87_C0026G0005 [Candidatus Amesbacteria bacterium GW2011_GWA1_47_16]KKU63774.1 MAG: hypothetical protein UX86_C0018G0010 [Candidatus Amesbacteria bacterium GW2011_GWC1_47_15]KKU97577.1 MAG: hypothetical protein UY28_C0018G0007 [Candidatus Amesbacteria bacterium GW2011_GWB1_48_13]OGC99286.1 MAG: hypothetical protein A2701_00995 [Candidatus Amesbacteria bacterium RIFCSPHIGHO2_01_FULL_47_34]OGC99703.1 MAG: hypothetical protein A2972_00545 [Candidatus Amesbacteria bact